MGDLWKASVWLFEDRAEMLYKYQMYDQSKFFKSLNDLEPKTICGSER